jgi:hypothetical protein
MQPHPDCNRTITGFVLRARILAGPARRGPDPGVTES